MRLRGLAEATAVLTAAVALACALTYLYAFKLDHVGRVDTNDGRWSIWVVSWVAHALTTDPQQVYRANIFYPHDDALAYSEANIAAGAVGVPVWLFTGNPYATHNFVVLVSFILVVRRRLLPVPVLTGSRPAAAVAGVLFAYCPFVFARTAHIQLLLIGGLPFCMLAFHRLIDRITVGRAVALGAILWFQGLACAYYGIFGGLAVGVCGIVLAITRKRWSDWRYWAGIAGAAVVSIALTVSFFIPYINLQRDTGFARSLDGARTYSANFAAWASLRIVGASLVARCHSQPLRVLFPGIVTLILGSAGAWIACEKARQWIRHRRREHLFPIESTRDCAGVHGHGSPRVLDHVRTESRLVFGVVPVVPVFTLLRAPSLTGIVVTLCLVVLASFAVARIVERRRHPWMIAAGVMALAVADLVQAPLGLRDARPTAPTYEELARQHRAPVAVFPFWARGIDFHGHAEYMLASTAHWQPMINGYSDHIPQDFRDNAAILRFPERVVGGAQRPGTLVVIHLQLYAGTSRDEITGKLEGYANYLRPLSKEGDVWLFEIVDLAPKKGLSHEKAYSRERPTESFASQRPASRSVSSRFEKQKRTVCGALLRVDVEAAAGNRRHADVLDQVMRKLGVASESERADVGHQIVGATRLVAGDPLALENVE